MLTYIHQIHNLFWRLKIPLLYSVCLQDHTGGQRKKKRKQREKRKSFRPVEMKKIWGGWAFIKSINQLG